MDSNNNRRTSQVHVQPTQQPQQQPQPQQQQQSSVATSGDGGGGDGGDWRSQLQPESRQRIVNKIMESLKRHLPFSGEEGSLELKKIAVRFEEKMYTAATSQPDYLRKISLKMLTMEAKSQNQNQNASSTPSNSVGNGRIVRDPAGAGNANDGDWEEEVSSKIRTP